MPSNYVKYRYVSNRPIYLNEQFVSVVGAGTSTVYNLTVTSGGGSIIGPYANDAQAASAGVEIDQPYHLSDGNLFGLPEGTVKVRTS